MGKLTSVTRQCKLVAGKSKTQRPSGGAKGPKENAKAGKIDKVAAGDESDMGHKEKTVSCSWGGEKKERGGSLIRLNRRTVRIRRGETFVPF